MEGVDVEAVDVCVVEAVAELPEGQRVALHGRPVLKHLPARRRLSGSGLRRTAQAHAARLTPPT